MILINGRPHSIVHISCYEDGVVVRARTTSGMTVSVEFGRPEYVWSMDAIPVTVSMNKRLRRAIHDACPRWYLQMRRAEKENAIENRAWKAEVRAEQTTHPTIRGAPF